MINLPAIIMPQYFINIIKKVWSVASPITASRIFNVLSNFLGFFMVAHLGHEALAASALITATQATLFLVMTSILFSVGVVVGDAYGAQRYKEIGSILQNGWFLAFCVSFIAVLITLLIKPILLTFGQQVELVDIVHRYFLAYSIAIPGLMGVITIQQFLIAVGKQKIVFRMSIFTFVGFVTFAWLLIYGIGPIPKFGVTGMAMAIVIQSWISLIVYLIICFKYPDFKRYKIFVWQLWSTFRFFRTLLVIGWPIALQTAGDLLSFFVVTIMVGWLGEYALAAQQIVVQYYILLVVPVLSLSQAGSILVSQAKGARNYGLAKIYGNTTVGVGIIFSLMVMILFILFPHVLINVYSHGQASPKVLYLGTIVLILTGCRLLFDTVIEIKIGSLRGLFDTKIPMWIALFFIWVIYIPLAYILGFTFHFGLIGIFVASLIVNIFGALGIWLRWVNRINRMSNVV